MTAIASIGEKGATRGRYSFEPIERLWAGDDRNNFAAVLGVSRPTLARYRRHGLNSSQADAIAVALGWHPGAIWPSWTADADLERCAWCGEPVPPTRVTCGDKCAHLVRVEREDVNRLGEVHLRRRAWWARLNRYRAS